MRTHAALGDSGALLKTYDDLLKAFRDELNTTPTPQIQALFKQLQQQLLMPADLPKPTGGHKENFVDLQHYPFLFRQGYWHLDSQQWLVEGSGVYAYLLSSQDYGEATFVLSARIRFYNYVPFQEKDPDTANAGIVLGWTPPQMKGKVGLRPWRARLECSFFEVQEDTTSQSVLPPRRL